MSYNKYLNGLLNESTLRDKIDKILDDDKRFSMPKNRRDIIKQIVAEFDGMTKKSITKLQSKLQGKMENETVKKIVADLQGMNGEILEILEKDSQKLSDIISDGRTNDGSIANFVKELLADLANFTDEELKAAVALENRISNVLLK
jgi:hypothetical protein